MKFTYQLRNRQLLQFRILIGLGILLNIIYLLGQTMALFNYEFTVSIGLQEPSSEITNVGVALNKGFGLGDTIFYMPLFLIGIIGLIKRTDVGLYAMIGAMAITVYWPIVCLSTLFFAKGSPGWHFSDYTNYLCMLSIIALYGIWALYFLYQNRSKLVKN